MFGLWQIQKYNLPMFAKYLIGQFLIRGKLNLKKIDADCVKKIECYNCCSIRVG